MNYENFSSEAKQAIEQFRKFTSKLKSDQIEFYHGDKYGNSYFLLGKEEKENYKSFDRIIEYGCHLFEVSYSEAIDLVQFAKDKNYWISKEVIANIK